MDKDNFKEYWIESFPVHMERGVSFARINMLVDNEVHKDPRHKLRAWFFMGSSIYKYEPLVVENSNPLVSAQVSTHAEKCYTV